MTSGTCARTAASRSILGMTISAPATRRRTVLRCTVHYLEMLAAMLVGMVALAPVWAAAWPGLDARPDLAALVMATNMSVGMALWMRVRRHGWRPIGEMCAAMYVAFLVLLPAYWAGLIDGEALLGIGHVLMLPLMLAALLREHRNPLRSAVSSLR